MVNMNLPAPKIGALQLELKTHNFHEEVSNNSDYIPVIMETIFLNKTA
jgi:hypothetical protein